MMKEDKASQTNKYTETQTTKKSHYYWRKIKILIDYGQNK